MNLLAYFRGTLVYHGPSEDDATAALHRAEAACNEQGKIDMTGKRTIAVDFDGVIHSYHDGWKDGSIYGTVVPGFFQWARHVELDFRIAVFSSRIANSKDAMVIDAWIKTQWREAAKRGEVAEPMPRIEVYVTKPPAWVSIDDRALTFKGDWADSRFSVNNLDRFRSWAQK